MEITFCDLRAKEVVNICDGKRLGNIIDIVFDSCCACITGIVVPGEKSFFGFFKNNPDIFIPFNKIRKIGRDVILVELNPANAPTINTLSTEQKASQEVSSQSTLNSNTYMPEIVEDPQKQPSKTDSTYLNDNQTC